MNQTKRQNTYDRNRSLAPQQSIMAVNFDVNTLVQTIASLQATVEDMQRTHETQVRRLEEQIRQARNPHLEIVPENQRVSIQPNITDENQVKLDVFKSLPVFNGDINNYRIWREDVSRMMETIASLSDKPIYAQALQIVKTKIQGTAAQILANHGTTFNFYAIRDRLDKTYADTRPLYVLQDEMKKCVQGKKSLGEFHDEISKCLNLIISKISMSGHIEAVTKAMISHAEEESVRVFIAGVSSTFIQSTLYANTPHDLEHAYTIARTIEHDNQHQNLRLSYDTRGSHKLFNNEQRIQQPRHHQHYQNQRGYQPQTEFRPRQPFNTFQPKLIDKTRQYQSPRYNNHQPQPEPMDTSSGNTAHRQPTHFKYLNYPRNPPWKREREPSGNFQQTKQLRNNNIITREDDNSSTIVETGIVNNVVVKHLN